MWRIKKDFLLDAIASAQKYLPTEFLCFLGGETNTKRVTEIVFLPSTTSKNAASISEYAIPFDDTIIGTLHSHPHGSSSPSNQDKKFFRKYQLNCILGYPYVIENLGFFDERGEKVEVIIEEI
jgi:proteasome lid subunit RPN8/RPN11